MLPKTGQGMLDKIFQPGGTLTIKLFLSMEKAQYDTAFGIALVLLVIVFGINMLTKYLAHKLNVNK
jgi:phosphate transport system permease protein